MRLVVNIEQTVYQDDYHRLEKAYAIEDPWNMNSKREQRRFQAINTFIQEKCGTIGSILEIGSGEGQHTQHLACLASEIVGFEISAAGEYARFSSREK